MSINLLSAWHQLPGVAHYLSQIKEDLSAGYSVLSILPESVPMENIWQSGLELLWTAHLDVEEIDLLQGDCSELPLRFLLQQYGQQANGNETVQTLATCLLPEIIAVRGIQQLPREQAELWVKFFQAWAIQVHAEASSTSTYRRKPARFWGAWTPHAPQDTLPGNETWLRVRPWWSLLSILDIRILCRLTEGLGLAQTSHLGAWREALIPYLAGPDVELVHRLWHSLNKPKDGIYQILTSAAQDRQWTVKQLEKWGLPSFLRAWQRSSHYFLQIPRQAERTLWLHGVLYQMPDYGIQVSAMALAILEQWNNLDHLLWRGQVALLLPIIDEYRVSICHELTERYGPDWALTWSNPMTIESRKELEISPLAAEWGHLENAILKSPYSQEKHRLRIIRFMRKMRNELAHYKPITYETYEELMSIIT